MRKKLLLVITALLIIACNTQKKDINIPNKENGDITFPIISTNGEIGKPETITPDDGIITVDKDTEKALKENKIKDVTFRALLLSENILTSDEEIRDYDFYKHEVPMGTYFWDEFGEYEEQYNLTDNESKLLGTWYNTAMNTGTYFRSYTFFPNNFFILDIKSNNYILIDNENKSLYRAMGTWKIEDGMVKITVHSIEIKDDEKTHPNNKDIVLLERPYTVDFINIDNIDARGYTKKPAYDRILSDELQKQVKVKTPNKTKNMYLRNVYSINNIPTTKKNYHYFANFPEMAEKNHSGLEIAANPELIRKYIPNWM